MFNLNVCPFTSCALWPWERLHGVYTLALFYMVYKGKLHSRTLYYRWTLGIGTGVYSSYFCNERKFSLLPMKSKWSGQLKGSIRLKWLRRSVLLSSCALALWCLTLTLLLLGWSVTSCVGHLGLLEQTRQSCALHLPHANSLVLVVSLFSPQWSQVLICINGVNNVMVHCASDQCCSRVLTIVMCTTTASDQGLGTTYCCFWLATASHDWGMSLQVFSCKGSNQCAVSL